MTKETKEEIKEPSENALLAEYQACQSHNNALSTEFWAVTAIMMSISVALLGGMFYTMMSNIMISNSSINVFISIIGLVIIVILGLVVLWLKRIQFMERVHHVRMREIENCLLLEKNWLVRGLDLYHKNEINQISERLKAKISVLSKRFRSSKWWSSRQFFYRYEYPIGSQVVFSIFSAVISFWLFFILSIWFPLWISGSITFVFLILKPRKTYLRSKLETI
jgi:ABC-type multidrug transport system fused ATPase/permease subunit